MFDWAESVHFNKSEFKCPCCGVEQMDPDFMRKLDAVRATLDFPFIISSGYRCAQHNQSVSSSGPSGPHTTGKACDIALSYQSARQALVPLATAFAGIGINQKGPKRFIHVDDLDPRIWTY